MSVYVGADVHCKRSQVALVTEDGKVQRRCASITHSARTPMVSGSRLTTTPATLTWSSGRHSASRSSFPAGGVKTQNHPDDRALPDRLRSLHCRLYGH
jgi:hypothetical protein